MGFPRNNYAETSQRIKAESTRMDSVSEKRYTRACLDLDKPEELSFDDKQKMVSEWKASDESHIDCRLHKDGMTLEGCKKRQAQHVRVYADGHRNARFGRCRAIIEGKRCQYWMTDRELAEFLYQRRSQKKAAAKLRYKAIFG